MKFLAILGVALLYGLHLLLEGALVSMAGVSLGFLEVV